MRTIGDVIASLARAGDAATALDLALAYLRGHPQTSTLRALADVLALARSEPAAARAVGRRRGDLAAHLAGAETTLRAVGAELSDSRDVEENRKALDLVSDLRAALDGVPATGDDAAEPEHPAPGVAWGCYRRREGAGTLKVVAFVADTVGPGITTLDVQGGWREALVRFAADHGIELPVAPIRFVATAPDPKIEGESMALPAVLAAFSLLVGRRLPADSAASGCFTGEGTRLGSVGGLREKAGAAAERGLRRFLCSPFDAEAVRSVGPGVEALSAENLEAAVEILWPGAFLPGAGPRPSADGATDGPPAGRPSIGPAVTVWAGALAVLVFERVVLGERAVPARYLYAGSPPSWVASIIWASIAGLLFAGGFVFSVARVVRSLRRGRVPSWLGTWWPLAVGMLGALAAGLAVLPGPAWWPQQELSQGWVDSSAVQVGKDLLFYGAFVAVFLLGPLAQIELAKELGRRGQRAWAGRLLVRLAHLRFHEPGRAPASAMPLPPVSVLPSLGHLVVAMIVTAAPLLTLDLMTLAPTTLPDDASRTFNTLHIYVRDAYLLLLALAAAVSVRSAAVRAARTGCGRAVRHAARPA